MIFNSKVDKIIDSPSKIIFDCIEMTAERGRKSAGPEVVWRRRRALKNIKIETHPSAPSYYLFDQSQAIAWVRRATTGPASQSGRSFGEYLAGNDGGLLSPQHNFLLIYSSTTDLSKINTNKRIVAGWKVYRVATK